MKVKRFRIRFFFCVSQFLLHFSVLVVPLLLECMANCDGWSLAAAVVIENVRDTSAGQLSAAICRPAINLKLSPPFCLWPLQYIFCLPAARSSTWTEKLLMILPSRNVVHFLLVLLLSFCGALLHIFIYLWPRCCCGFLFSFHFIFCFCLLFVFANAVKMQPIFFVSPHLYHRLISLLLLFFFLPILLARNNNIADDFIEQKNFRCAA